MRYVNFLAVGLALALSGPGIAQDQKPAEPKPVQVPRDPDGFGRFVADQVTAAVSGATVKIEKPLVLTLTVPGFAGEQQLPLERIWDYCQRNASSCALALAMLPSSTLTAICHNMPMTLSMPARSSAAFSRELAMAMAICVPLPSLSPAG